MADKSFMLASLLRPILAPAMAFLWLGALWVLWKKFPEGKIKRILFFNLWGGKDDPWVKAYAKKPKDIDLGRIEPQGPVSLPRYQSQEADPERHR